jgi:hypothetical protein
MEEALSFFRAYEVWIYLILGLGGLFFVRKFIYAWKELQGAAFGLERESAQARLNQSAFALVLLLTMAVAEFVLVSFVAPSIPGASPLLTPTLDLLATATTTLPAQDSAVAQGEPLVTAPVTTETPESACIPGEIEITSPLPGQEINGIFTVEGSASIENFGFYKFEMMPPGSSEWLTVQAGNIPVQSGRLVDWDTRRLTPGDYQLRLVLVDNQAQSLPPCEIHVRVAPTPEETPEL